MIQIFWTSSNNRRTFDVIVCHLTLYSKSIIREVTMHCDKLSNMMEKPGDYDTSLQLTSSVTLPGNQLGNTFGTFSKLNDY